PDDPEAWLLLANCVIGGKLFDRVPKALTSAEEYGAPKEQTAFIAAQCLFDRGGWDSASVLAASISLGGKTTPAILTAAADYFEKSGLWDSSMALSRNAMESANHDFDAVHDHFYRSLRTKHFGDARSIINWYKDRKADSILVCGLEMICYQASGHRMAGAQFSSLYREIAPIVDISPTYWDMRMRQYQADEFSGDQDAGALEKMMKTAKWLPDFQQYMYDLITLEVPFCMFSKIVDERLVKMKQPWTQRRRFKMAQARLRDRWGQIKEFDSSMIVLKQQYGSDPVWMADIADLYNAISIDKWDSAHSWYTKTLSAQNWTPETFLKFITMYDRMQKYDLEILACDQFPQYEQHLPQVGVLRAIDEVRLGKIDEGLARFAKHYPSISGATVYADTMLQALREREAEDRTSIVYDLLATPTLAENVDALSLLADHAWMTGNYGKSLELCERAESREPNNGFLLARKARALHGVGRKEEAFALFEKVLLEQPRTTNAYMYYSQLLVNDPSQYDKAANWARGACVETDAGLTEVLNLCEIYYKVGRFDLMLGEAGKLLNIHPHDPEPPYWVGLGLYLNHRDSVKMFLDKSIALGLKGEKLQKARETLSKL
ncbi:MAG: hypothetical protein AAB305_06120, partial [Candidatus Zixiibacteriota bacterium]